MGALTEAIIGAGLQDRILSEAQLSRLLAGSAQRRYNLVNRALRSGELMRLRRGRYRLAAALKGRLPHPFVVAQALVAGSYVSLESALSYHGWIPEAVPSTQSIAPGRRSDELSVPGLGSFRFWPLALNRGFFLEAVDRVTFDGQAAFVAQPLRAVFDRLCLLKQDWPGLNGSCRQTSHVQGRLDWAPAKSVFLSWRYGSQAQDQAGGRHLPTKRLGFR